MGRFLNPKVAGVVQFCCVGVLVTTVAAGCGAEPQINADTTCGDYLQRPSGERHDAATRISAEIDGVSHPGNPMWGFSLDGACGRHADMTLREYFGGGG